MNERNFAHYIYLAVVLYKIQNDEYNFADGRARCDQDSDDAGVSGFLSMPTPRSDAENQIYYDIVSGGKAYLDIVEVLPITSPRSWVYRDGSPATYLKWTSGEPNYPEKEHNVEIGRGGRSSWNNLPGSATKLIVCTYSLPAGAQNTCPWLNDFED